MSRAGEVYTVELRACPLSLDWVLELGLHWVQAEQKRVVLVPQVSPEHQHWLKWLGLPCQSEPCFPAPSLPHSWSYPVLQVPAALDVAGMRQQGIMAEMLVSYLVQLAWTPSLAPSCRPLSEVVKFFRASEVLQRVRPFDLDELLDINATRLQELTPRELLEVSREWWEAYGRPEDIPDENEYPLLEAWALLFAEHCRTLHDVARHLAKFWLPPQGRRLALPSDWYEQLENGQYLDDDVESELLEALTGDFVGDLRLIAPLLGPQRCHERVQTNEET